MSDKTVAFLDWRRERVSISPDVLGGEPVFVGTRLSVRMVGLSIRAGHTDEIREDYPYLTDRDCEFAVHYGTDQTQWVDWDSIPNPYLTQFNDLANTDSLLANSTDSLLANSTDLSFAGAKSGNLADIWSRTWIARERFCRIYSWAIPDASALRCIARYEPIVEIGAGNGYWGALLRIGGVSIEAFDIDPPRFRNNQHIELPYEFVPIRSTEDESEALSALLCDPGYTLFICWATYEGDFAYRYLKRFVGQYFICVGEGPGGCTADDQFFSYLEENFEEIETVAIPQWVGIHDYLAVYRRK